MKRIPFILTVLLLAVLTFLPCKVHSTEVISGGKWDGGPVTWKVTSDGTLTISGNRSVQESATYPWTEHSHLITKIVVEDGITTIPREAFKFLSNVTEVYIGNKVESIAPEAFWGCTSLETVSFPASLKTIGSSAFYGCTNLKTVSFASAGHLTSIEEKAFYECGLTALTTPSSLRSIGGSAFENCTSLETVTLTDGLEELAASAFYGCWNVKELYLGETFSTNTHHFKDFVNIEKLTTGTPVTPHFSNCTTLKEVYIVGKTSIIGMGCFEGCKSLTKVVIDAPVTKIGACAFLSCSSLTEITLCEGIKEIGGHAFEGTPLTHILIPDSVTTIGAWAFHECNYLLSVCCGDGMIEIEQAAFKNCAQLTTLDLGNTQIIGFEAFSHCYNLQDVIWSPKLETLGDSCFFNCSKISSVTLAPSVTNVGSKAFKSCMGLKSVVFLGSAPYFADVSDYDADKAFCYVTAIAYYPQDNSTWTSWKMQNYDGTITWKPLCQNHTPLQIPAQVATCSQAGKTTSEVCAECGIMLKEWQLIPPSAHVFTTVQREPACGKVGAYIHNCNFCDYQYEIPYADALEHNFGDWERILAATHTTQGENRRTCTLCGQYETKYTPVVPHIYQQWTIEKEPDYGVEGEERRYCTGCDHYESRTLAALVPKATDEASPSRPYPSMIWLIIIGVSVVAIGSVAVVIITRKKRS